MKKSQKSITAIALTTIMTMNQFVIPTFAQESDVENTVDTTTETNEMNTSTDSSQEDVQIQEETNQILEEEKNTDNKVSVSDDTENEKLASDPMIITLNQTDTKAYSSEKTENSVAEVNMNGTTTYYDTLNEAFDTVPVDGIATITLLKDAQLNGSAVAGKSINGNITFIGGDYTISGNNFGIDIGGNLTIESGNFSSNIPLVSYGTLNIDGGTFHNLLILKTGGYINIYNGNINILRMDGGTATIEGGHLASINNLDHAGTVNVYGGTIDSVAGKVNYFIDTITLNKTSISLAPNTTETLQATIDPVISAPSLFSWESSDEGVATVKNGIVTAVALGNTTITVRAGGKEATCTVTVASVPATIDYVNEAVHVRNASTEYVVVLEDGSTKTIKSDLQGFIPIENEWFGNTIGIRLVEATESETQKLTIPSRPDTPTKLKGEITGTGEDDCKITGLEDNISYEISSNNGQTWNDATIENGEITGLSLGTYQVRVKASDKSFASLPATVTIEKPDSSIAFKEDFNLSKTYDGKQVTIDVNEDVVTTGSTGNVSFVYEKNVNGTWQKLSSAPSGAGTYRVTANLAEDTNYKGASVTKEFIIHKAKTTVGFIQTNIDKEYDGKPAFVRTKQSGSSNVATKTWYELDKDGTWRELKEAPTNAGSYKVVATVKGNDNYNGAEAEMTFVIRKAKPSYTLSTDLVIKQGDALSTVSLPDGFTWVDYT